MAIPFDTQQRVRLVRFLAEAVNDWHLIEYGYFPDVHGAEHSDEISSQIFVTGSPDQRADFKVSIT